MTDTESGLEIRGRAQTDQDKSAVLARLGAVWKANPHLRLGQLITNAIASPYYAEDEFLIREVELYYQRTGDDDRA